ncbi:MAG: amidohydrolase family protein [Pyramidobacter sp.]|nr:amidohydrolase family protein [Pyramidobacter sp.]
MFSYAVKNATVIDGTRCKPYKANIYIAGDAIAEITAEDREAERSFDAAGLVAAPGFIDIHTHSDATFLTTPTHEGKLLGGVTFELAGQCGLSLVPNTPATRDENVFGVTRPFLIEPTLEQFPAHDFAGYVKAIREKGISINFGSMVGHGALRACIVGYENRQLTPEELDQMCELLAAQLDQGALGVSFGLIYPPGSFCDTAEVVALARVAASRSKLLAVHMRNENARVFEALDEMIAVARETGVRLEISHLKLMGQAQWGRAQELLNKIDLARAQGVRIHADQYPYCASHSGLKSSFPKWATSGGDAGFVARLKDDATWAKITENGLPEMEARGGAPRINISSTNGLFPEIEGMTLPEVAAYLKLPLLDGIREALIRCNGTIGCIYHAMSRKDMLTIMKRTDICAASDGRAYPLDPRLGKVHPRNSSTFVRFLRTVREEHLMPLEDAVYKITALPATLLGLDDELGYIKAGHKANLTILNPDTVTDTATYADPLRKPEGIAQVIVNGQVVLDNGTITDARPGKVYAR